MPAEVVDARVTEDVIDARAIEASVSRDAAGAVTVFHGVVRDHDGGKSVTQLNYEAHPSADSLMRTVAEEIAAEFDVLAISAVHRVGQLAIGDAALVAAVSSAHRAEAFAALSALIDRLKERIPVWKHQVFADGTDEWVNSA